MSWLLDPRTDRPRNAVAPYSSYVQQWLDRLSLWPDSTHLGYMETFINGLVSDGVWAKLDFLKLYGASDLAIALPNLISSSYNGSTVAEPIFTADRGLTGSGLGQCINTGFNPATASSPNFTQNDSCFFVWSLTSSLIDKAILRNTSGNRTYLWPRPGGGNLHYVLYACNHGVGSEFTPSPDDASGFWLVNRTAAGASAIYRNNSLLNSNVAASSAVTSEDFLCPFGDFQTAIVGGGSAMNTAPLRAALYARCSGLLTSLGAI